MADRFLRCAHVYTAVRPQTHTQTSGQDLSLKIDDTLASLAALVYSMYQYIKHESLLAIAVSGMAIGYGGSRARQERQCAASFAR